MTFRCTSKSYVYICICLQQNLHWQSLYLVVFCSFQLPKQITNYLKVTQCTFKVHLKVMLAPVNYDFLHQELCVFVCLQARKKVVQCTFKVTFFHWTLSAHSDSSPVRQLTIMIEFIALFHFAVTSHSCRAAVSHSEDTLAALPIITMSPLKIITAPRLCMTYFLIHSRYIKRSDMIRS